MKQVRLKIKNKKNRKKLWNLENKKGEGENKKLKKNKGKKYEEIKVGTDKPIHQMTESISQFQKPNRIPSSTEEFG